MMYSEDDCLNISGIQHFVFCRRQWALIHIEKQWAENLLTINGELMHKNAHNNSSSEKRGNIIISRGLPVISRELGISGVCDVVEFHKSDDGALLKGYDGLYKILPVEYKHGEPKDDNSDILQTAAQALCLEEMFCTKIDEIHLYYGKIKHRQKINLDESIREELKKIVAEMHSLFLKGHTPKVKTSKKCRACSLSDLCLPKMLNVESVGRYVSRFINEE